jgi:dCTP diphosphatase
MADRETTVAQMREWMEAFVAERDWHSYHDPKNLSMSIAIEAAELMEHFQWTRSADLSKLLENEAKRSEIRDEMADIACYLLSMANALGMDLSDAVRDKLVKNAAKYPAEKFRGRYI